MLMQLWWVMFMLVMIRHFSSVSRALSVSANQFSNCCFFLSLDLLAYSWFFVFYGPSLLQDPWKTKSCGNFGLFVCKWGQCDLLNCSLIAIYLCGCISRGKINIEEFIQKEKGGGACANTRVLCSWLVKTYVEKDDHNASAAILRSLWFHSWRT